MLHGHTLLRDESRTSPPAKAQADRASPMQRQAGIVLPGVKGARAAKKDVSKERVRRDEADHVLHRDIRNDLEHVMTRRMLQRTNLAVVQRSPNRKAAKTKKLRQGQAEIRTSGLAARHRKGRNINIFRDREAREKERAHLNPEEVENADP